MIATFLVEPDRRVQPNTSPTVHAVLHVAREGLKVKSHGWCGAQGNAAEGTYQIPDWVFDGRPVYNFAPAAMNWHVCPRCTAALKQVREPPPGS